MHNKYQLSIILFKLLRVHLVIKHLMTYKIKTLFSMPPIKRKLDPRFLQFYVKPFIIIIWSVFFDLNVLHNKKRYISKSNTFISKCKMQRK